MWDCSSKLDINTIELYTLFVHASHRLILNYISKDDLNKILKLNDYDPDELVKSLKRSTCDKKFNRYFDKLPNTEKIYAIHFVLDNMFDKEKPAPKLRAWNESAISALFSQISNDVCCDQFTSEKTQMLVYKAIESINNKNNINSMDLSNISWSSAIDYLKYEILYDNDYDLPEEHADKNEYFFSIQENLGKRKISEMIIEIIGLAKQFDLY